MPHRDIFGIGTHNSPSLIERNYCRIAEPATYVLPRSVFFNYDYHGRVRGISPPQFFPYDDFYFGRALSQSWGQPGRLDRWNFLMQALRSGPKSYGNYEHLKEVFWISITLSSCPTVIAYVAHHWWNDMKWYDTTNTHISLLGHGGSLWRCLTMALCSWDCW